VAFKDRLGKLNETVDRLKTQAGTLADKAQEQARIGQQRLEQFQAKKQADQLLLELGGLSYLEHQGRLDDEGRQRIASLLDQLRSFEATNGPIVVTRAVPPPGATGSYVPGGTGGTPPPSPPAGTGPLPRASYASDAAEATEEAAGPAGDPPED
jgi:hypothetical protein